MHAALQTGGHSPKPECGLASTSQLKPISYCVPNSVTLPSSLTKGKKRERVDNVCEPTKRERVSKPEDSDLCHLKPEATLKSEIIKIAGRGGGLVDMEGVEKLLQLVAPEKSDRKIDLASRSLLAGVIAATENPDCLSHFVQFKGLLLLDEWIQDVHKGKIGSSRYSDDFLLVLLRSLDNLPVDLNALQMCNIGKSVNHLRTHKNIEIQKKARVLVDTWKKRVKAEFNNQDVKQGPPPAVQWPSRTTGGRSLDSGSKSSVTQASIHRNTPVKPVHGDTMKSTSAALSRCVSSVSLSNFKDIHSRGGPLIDPQSMINEENTCATQYTNNMSSTNDHMKVTSSPTKEDQKNSSKNSHRALKLASDVPPSGSQRETHVLSRSSSPHQNISSGTADEKACEVAATSAEDSPPKLIVKIPNCRQVVTISPCEDSSLAYTHSPSNVMVESHGQPNNCSKDTNNTHGTNVASDVNTESWQSNDFKDVFTGSDEGDGPLAPIGDDCYTSGNDAEKAMDPSQATSLFSENECNHVTTPELCSGPKIVSADASVNISGGSTDIPTEDDSGMDLLASVAAGELQSAGHCNSPFSKDDVVCVDTSFIDTRKESEKHIDSNEPSCFSGSEMLPAPKTNLVEAKSDVGGIMVVDSVPVMCSSCFTEIIDNGECKMCKERMTVDISAVAEGGTTEIIPKLTASLPEKGRAENLSSLAQEGECVGDKPKIGDEFDSKSSDPIVIPCSGLENRDLCPLPSKPLVTMVELVEENLENKENDRMCSGGSVSGIRRLSKHVDSKLSVEVDETDECASSTAVVSSFSDSSGSDTDSKPGFDLNEGIMAEDGRSGDVNSSGTPGCSNSLKMVTSFPLSFPPISVCISSPITVAAAAKGPFMPLDDLMKSISEPGWKGSAATSAFRPAEPRRAMEALQSEQSRPMLDFDLNLPDEASFEEPVFRTPCDPSTSVNNSYSSHDLPTSRCSVGFDLDLNRADVPAELTPSSTPSCSRLQLFPPYPSSTGHSDDACCRGKFDLNNGPNIDDSSTISPFFCRNLRSGPSSQEPTSCIKMNSPEPGSFTSWFPSGGNKHPTIGLPTLFSDRGDPSFPPIIVNHPRMLTASSGGGHFPSDAYQVPVMPSSHAISFQPSPFQYPLFPFGATLPLPSATFSVGSSPYGDSSSGGRAVPFHAIQTQILAHPSVVSSHFQRPYAPRIPDGCSTSPLDGGRRWTGHGLDLNDGPLGPEMEGRGEAIPAVLRQQHSVSSSAEEHGTRMYQMASAALKKRDSEGGWDIRYRLPSCH